MPEDRIDPLHTLNGSAADMISKIGTSSSAIRSSYPYSSNSDDRYSFDSIECCVCEMNIDHNFYVFKSMFYCRDHYKSSAGNYCVVCEDIDVKGPVIKINNIDVHTECFECAICFNYINQNEPFSLYNNQRLICSKCMNSLNVLETHPKLPVTNIPVNPPHHLYFIKFHTEDFSQISGATTPQFKVGLKPISFSPKNSVSTHTLSSFKNLSLSKELLTNSSSFLSSPKQGLLVTKFETNDDITQQHPPILENDVLVMVNDLPCIGDNSHVIEEILMQNFSIVKTIYLLRTVVSEKQDYSLAGLETTSTLPLPSPHKSPPSSSIYKSILSILGNKPKKKVTSDASSRHSTLDLKSSSQHTIHEQLNSPISSSVISIANKRMDGLNCLSNNSDDILMNCSNLDINISKRYSYGSKDTRYKLVQNNLERSQSQTLYNSRGQVFTQNDLLIEESLGEGFFGKALKVINKHNHEQYAMKILKVVNKLTLNNFRKEVQLMKSVNHPNLVKFIGVILTPESINVLMEFISGGTLKKYIESIRKNTKPMFTAKQMYSMVLGMSSGMAYLHSKNIAHRDLTSSNCLLKDHKKLNIVISDFGLSEVITQKHTRLAVVGSPYWMAPEMLNGKIYDIKVDIFSFGIIICEITTLLDASPDYLKRNKDFSLDIDSYMHDLQPGVPTKLSNLAVKCCDMDPDKRPLFSNIYNIVSLDYELSEKYSKKKPGNKKQKTAF